MAQRLPDRGPGSGRERDTGSLGILCTAHALVHTEIQTLSLYPLIIRAHGSNRVLQLDTIHICEQAMTTCTCFRNLLFVVKALPLLY